MRISKKMDKLLQRRTKLAKQLDEVCYEIDTWLDAHGVEPDTACCHTGVETYVNPDASERKVRRAIEQTGAR